MQRLSGISLTISKSRSKPDDGYHEKDLAPIKDNKYENPLRDGVDLVLNLSKVSEVVIRDEP